MTAILPASDKAAVSQALALLKAGDVVVFPTDTIYGIGASITHEAALQKIFTIKARPENKAIVVFVPDFEALEDICEGLSDERITVLRHFWPGQLTVIFNKKDTIPDWVTAGKATVAVRIPDSPLCMSLARQLGHPMAVTSANISSMPTPSTATEVAEQLSQALPLVLDGGPSPEQKPSTIIDFAQQPPRLLREGVLSFEHLKSFIPDLQ